MKAAGVKILRWVKIRSAANPYDPEWELYLEERLAWKLSHTLAGRGRIEYGCSSLCYRHFHAARGNSIGSSVRI